MAVATLSDLPNETITDVVGRITDVNTVSAISQTCHRLRHITEPFLYRSVNLHGYNSSSTSFVRTVISRPALGCYVKEIFLDEGAFHCNDDDYDYSEWLAECQSFCLNASDRGEEGRAASPLGPEDLRLILQAADPDDDKSRLPAAFVVILLHYLPRLETFRMEECYLRPELIANAVLGHLPGGIPAGLVSLRKLNISFWDTEGGFNSADVLPFFTLPKLLSVEVAKFAGVDGNLLDDGNEGEGESAVDQDEVHSASSMAQRGSSVVTSISFPCSAVDSALLRRILHMPRALESFSYTIGGALYGESLFYPYMVGTGLRVQRNSLKVLHLINEGEEITDDEEEQNTLLGSFRDFVVLERIVLPLKMLVGPPPASFATDWRYMMQFIDLLPPSLVSLTVGLENGWTPENFATFIGVRSGKWGAWRRERFPRLETFRVSHETATFSDELQQEYVEAGIQLLNIRLERAAEMDSIDST